MSQEISKDIIAALEALLFIYGEPLPIKKIAKILGQEELRVLAACGELSEKLSGEDRGLALIVSDERAQLVSKPEFGQLLEDLVKEELHETLTPAALETLAIIAYAGPVSRSVIDYIRGVNSTFILRTLLLRGLVDRSLDPQRSTTYLYRPSFDFLKHIGVSKLEDLPEYQRFREIVEKLKTA